MSGHSKWATIKRKKAVVDAKRSKVWTKVLKEIQVAAKMGGPDPDGNSRLRLAIDKGRAANVPKDRIQGAIDKGSGATGGQDFEEIVYEGYGPGGAALLVEAMTDNRARTVSDVRHVFDRFGGHLGTSGSVAWMFHRRGIIHLLRDGVDEDRLLELALDAGASDVRDEGEVWTVETEPAGFLAVQDALTGAGLDIANAEIDNLPETRVALEGSKALTMVKLVHALEDLDDVQNVYANHDVPDDVHDQV